MRERSNLLRGRLDIDTRDGRTEVRVRVPTVGNGQRDGDYGPI
jgi:signal transduction histidine kinase